MKMARIKVEMFAARRQAVVPDRAAAARVLEELRELRKLARDRRVASLALLRSAKGRALLRTDCSPRRLAPAVA
jgi:hypothetical protein